jgi:myo-inositol 2-dehydrogenase / D-chiro-inositol 1-dehydrogenase
VEGRGGADGTVSIKIGIIGCGEVGVQKHLRVLSKIPELEVAAVADTDAGRAASSAKGAGVGRHFQTAEDLLAQADIEAVGVCVPPSAHADVAVAALEAGKHVLVEKPLALTLEDAGRIIAAEAKSPKLCLMGFHMRSHRLVRQVRDAIVRGDVGEIESVRVSWFSPRDDVDLPAWRSSHERGGGALIEIGVHCYDLWRYLAGGEVDVVSAFSRSGIRDDECAVVTGQFTDGAVATALLSERTVHEIEIEVCGDAGRLRAGCQRFDGFELLPFGVTPGRPVTRFRALRSFLLELPGGLSNLIGGGDYLDSYREQWYSFYRSMTGGAPLRSTLVDGRKALEITLAALGSVHAGNQVIVNHVQG